MELDIKMVCYLKKKYTKEKMLWNKLLFKACFYAT